MKIALLNYTIGIVERGGELGTQMLADDLSLLGHQVDVFQGQALKKKTNHNQIIINLPSTPTSRKPKNFLGKILERLYFDKNGLLSLLFSFQSFPKLITTSYDIYFPVNGFWQILICKLAKLLNAGKIVVSGKSGIGWTDRHNLSLRPDLFVPISKKAQKWAKKIAPDINVQYIPEQIDHQKFNPSIKPKKLFLSHPIILTVAAFTKYKRIDAVIKAVSKLKSASLLIVGHGEEKESLTQLSHKLLKDRFKIITSTYQELSTIYTACDVFTLASEPQEAFGRVLIEAMACGLPIVTTDDPLRRSLLGKMAIYTDITNPDKYATALNKALKNKPQTSQLIKQTKQYDRQIIAKQYLKLFQQIIKE